MKTTVEGALVTTASRNEESHSATESVQTMQTLLGTDDTPVDLSTKKENDSDSTASTSQGILSCLE